MYALGRKSTIEVNTLHPDLQLILKVSITHYDFSIIEGIRTAKRQNSLFTMTPPRTTLDGYDRKSKHQGKLCLPGEAGRNAKGELLKDENGNPMCSYAADITPYKKGEDPWKDTELNLRRYYFLMGIIRAVAEDLLARELISHRVRFGLDWDSDDVYSDQSFHDLPHMELISR